MTLCFMIMKKYLREKLEEQQRTGEFIERRTYKPYWRARIGAPSVWKHRGHSEVVFLCGKNVFNADVQEITIDSVPTEVMEVVEGSLCYNIRCKFQPNELNRLHQWLRRKWYQPSMEM